MDPEAAGIVLERLAALASWTQAQQALVVHRMETLIAHEVQESLQKQDEALAMSLTAAEIGAVLKIPHMSAMQLVSDSADLCTSRTATLAALSHGHISHRHARAVLDQLQAIPLAQAPAFEAELLVVARERTCAQFTRTARRLRERRWPETISARHRSALDLRRVSFDPLADGMGEFCARVAVEKGQAIFTALTFAAQGEQKAGDPRTLDQLRADIFTSLMLRPGQGPLPPADVELGQGPVPDSGQPSGTGEMSVSGRQPEPVPRPDPRLGQLPTREQRTPGFGSGTVTTTPEPDWDGSACIRAEVMVLISADTLLGIDHNPAELSGIGPISAESARRLAHQALHWTGLVQDPSSGEILSVGRRRKIPAGLKRWLQARDGTCRFPGCGVGTARTEIDHTRPWVSGGLTEHGNLANLCPKHHRYKTLGFWRVQQPKPGILVWTSPLGRVYRSAPQLDYGAHAPDGHSASGSPGSSDPDPPPF